MTNKSDKIIEIMNKHGFDSKIVDDNIFFQKESENCKLDFSLKFNLSNLEEEIKDLENQEDVYNNFLKYSAVPELLDKAHLLLKDLIQIRADILEASIEINNEQLDNDEHFSEFFALREALEETDPQSIHEDVDKAIHNKFNNFHEFGFSDELSSKISIFSYFSGSWVRGYKFLEQSTLDDVWEGSLARILKYIQDKKRINRVTFEYVKFYIIGIEFDRLKNILTDILEDDEYIEYKKKHNI